METELHDLNSAIHYLNSENKDQKSSYFLEFLRIHLQNCDIFVSFRTYKSYNQLHIIVIKARELYNYLKEICNDDELINDIWLSTSEEIVCEIGKEFAKLKISD